MDRLFGMRGKYWVSPYSLIVHMQLFYVSFGRQKHQKTLWRCAFMANIWVLCIEWNDRVFYKRLSNIEGL